MNLTSYPILTLLLIIILVFVPITGADWSSLSNLTNAAEEDTSPSISGDGSKIAFSRFDGNDQEIFVINFDGSELTQ